MNKRCRARAREMGTLAGHKPFLPAGPLSRAERMTQDEAKAIPKHPKSGGWRPRGSGAQLVLFLLASK